MRTLGIETSSRRGSVALVENGEVVAAAEYEELHAHAERMLPLIGHLMANAGWSRSTLDRVAVGVGPGSFTGLRVGIALGQGIALGISVPLLGITSLEAMAHAVSSQVPGARCTVLDARRSELYLAAYSQDLRVVHPPLVVPPERAIEIASELARTQRVVAVGEAAFGLALSCEVIRGTDSDLPHARAVAQLGEQREPSQSPATPTYIREADAVLPHLPVSPLDRPRLFTQ